MTTYTFRKEEFSSLAFEEYTGKWNSVGLADLNPDEQSLLELFLSYVGDGIESLEAMDLENLLLVKSAEGGILSDVYGPCLFKKDDEHLVLKVGNNEFAVAQDKVTLTVGNLEGTLSFEDEPIKIKLKDKNGGEYEVELYNATCDFMPTDGTELVFRVRCAFQPETNPQPGAVKAAMRRGASTAKFFKPSPVKGEGGDTLKMPDLGEGEFKVAGIRKLTGGQYGDSYIIDLADGRSVWARGTVSEVLKSGWEMPQGQSLTLVIANIKQKSDGKFSLDCALRMREPRELGNQSLPKIAQKPNVKQLVAAAVSPTKMADADIEVDYEEIPY